tara:strand:- start:292 stop:1509 length:1218 start_codon:yes stop_codon:yes gene_type:complete
MKELFSLGDLYVSDFAKVGEASLATKEPLTLMLEESTGAVRLSSVTDPDKMYRKYWYRSGVTSTMTQELKSIAEELPDLIPVENGDVFLDIACNDGTLLKFAPKSMTKVGVDPVDDSYYKESTQRADLIIQDYFSAEAYKTSKFGHKKAKIISIIAMFYDIDDPVSCLNDISEIMDDEGLLVLQMSYTPLMLKQLAFDNICHEHIYYYTLTSIKKILESVGFTIVDCILNDINGGSFRVYIRKNSADKTNFRSAPYRDVADFRTEALLQYEDKMGAACAETYHDFYKRICVLKDETVAFIKKIKSEGKTVWAYGASTKGNTLLQWYGLDNSHIDGIAERTPYKFGLSTVGTNIPIYSEDEMRKIHPDYLLILPWHFINEFTKREKEYLGKGGKFIVPCPKLQIIS